MRREKKKKREKRGGGERENKNTKEVEAYMSGINEKKMR